MANTRSALKAWRQSLKRRLRNHSVRSAVKTRIRVARETIATGNVETAAGAVRAAVSALDKAAEKALIHSNNAARRKSRLLRLYNAAVRQAQAAQAAAQAAVTAEKPRRRTRRKVE